MTLLYSCFLAFSKSVFVQEDLKIKCRILKLKHRILKMNFFAFMGIPCKCLAVITVNGIFFQQSGMCVRTWACMCTCMYGSMFYIMYLWIVPQHTYLHWHIHLFLGTYEGLVPSTLLIRVSKSKGAKFLSVRIWPCPFFLYFIHLIIELLAKSTQCK